MTDADSEPAVSETIFRQYEQIRRSGECNMFDKSCLQWEAYDHDFHEFVVCIDDGRYGEILKQYADLANLPITAGHRRRRLRGSDGSGIE